MGAITEPCGERVHQCEMFEILQHVVKLVIKPTIFSPVARQPCRQPFCAPLVGVVFMLASKYELDTTTQY